MKGEPQNVIQTIKSELSIFDDHAFQVTHLKGQWSENHPSNIYEGSDGASIIFNIPKAEAGT